MTRKYSEDQVRNAITVMDLDTVLFKPMDFAGPMQNRKPADFIVWWADELITGAVCSALIEVKENKQVAAFPLSAFTPSQVASMHDAIGIALPYWIAVRWAPTGAGKLKPFWAITSARRVIAAIDVGLRTSIARTDFLAECPPAQLASTLRACLLGEFD